MSLPKKKINVIPQKSGQKQVQELLANTNEKSTFLPRSILLEDLDRGMLDFVKDTKLSIDIDGKKVPVVFLTNERWSEFEKTWKFSDDDNAAVMPFITIRRVDAPKPGTNPVTKYGVPERAKYTYIKVPTLDNGVRGVDIYQIPQPVAVDVDYEVRFFTHYMVDVNKFNELVNKSFYSRQAYANIKGHYIPIIMNGVTDESTMDVFDGQRYYNQSFNFTMLGYLQDEKEFKVVKGLRRTLVFNELGEDLTGEIDLGNGEQATFTKTEFLSAKGGGKSGAITRPGGTSGQVQFNFGGYFEGDPSFTFLNGFVNIVNLITTAITATTYYSGNTPLNDILSGTASNTNGINLSDNGIFGSKVGSNLQFLGISAGTNITIISGASAITINSTASGSGGGFDGWTSSTGSNSIILNSSSNIAISAITIAGGSGNTTQGIGSGILWGRGNLISGNSPNSIIAGGSGNTITNNHSAILGGKANNITSIESIVGGGSGNTILANRSFIGGGRGNKVNSGIYSTIAGGDNNFTNAARASIVGGKNNSATATYSFIGGGNNNRTNGSRSSIVGGVNNFVFSQYTSIVGGNYNSSTTRYSFIGNGILNKIIGGYNAFIGNGRNNYINGYGAYGNTIINGNYNSISGNTTDASFIGNGNRNAIVGLNSFIGTGFLNRINGDNNFIGSGRYNLVSGNPYSNIVGGINNNLLASRASIVGGNSNGISATATYSFIGGGNNNVVTNIYGVVIGGRNNKVSSTNGTVVGGINNNVQSQFGTILNGSANTLTSTAINSTIISLSGFTGIDPHTVYMPFVNTLFNLTATTYLSGSTPLNTILSNYIITGATVGITGQTNIFIQKSGSTLVFRNLSAGTNISLTTTTGDTIVINSSGSGSQTNIQNGLNTYTGSTSALPTINISGGTFNGDSIFENRLSATTYYSGGSEVNTILSTYVTNGSNVSGNSIFGGKSNSVIQFLGISAGTNVTITSGTSVLTINSTASGGFDGWTAGTGINSIKQNHITTSANSNMSLAFGSGNTITSTSPYSSILGGKNNTIISSFGHNIIAGGANNIISFYSYNFMGGGRRNFIRAANGVIVGGQLNSARSDYSFIGGGNTNQLGTTSNFSIIVGGYLNSITNSSTHSIIVGGRQNNNSGRYNFIGTGRDSINSGNYNAVIGGRTNINVASYGVIVGGQSNSVRSNWGSVLGGLANGISANSNYSTIAGGKQNKIANRHSFIAAGSNNIISGISSSIIAGSGNTINNNINNTSIIGGINIIATTSNSSYFHHLATTLTANTTTQTGNTIGLATLSSGFVVIPNNIVTVNSLIFVTAQNASANAGEIGISAKTNNTSFTIYSSNASDDREVGWWIVLVG